MKLPKKLLTLLVLIIIYTHLSINAEAQPLARPTKIPAHFISSLTNGQPRRIRVTDEQYIKQIKSRCHFPKTYNFPNNKVGRDVLSSPITFVDTFGDAWTAPNRTITDGASIPKAAQWITACPKDNEVRMPAAVHDAYCSEDNKSLPTYQVKSVSNTSRMFFEACILKGLSKTKAKLCYAAVYICGPQWTSPPFDSANYDVFWTLIPYSQTLDAEKLMLLELDKKWIKKYKPHFSSIETIIRAQILLLSVGQILAPPTEKITFGDDRLITYIDNAVRRALDIK